MGFRVKNISGFGFGLGWQSTTKDSEVAERVLTTLEDRRLLLFSSLAATQTDYAVGAANWARRILTEAAQTPDIGDNLKSSIKTMRAAFRRFADRIEFYDQRAGTRERDTELAIALGELRAAVGVQAQALAYNYKIEVEEEFAEIFPPQVDDDDPSIVPGFESQWFQRRLSSGPAHSTYTATRVKRSLRVPSTATCAGP